MQIENCHTDFSEDGEEPFIFEPHSGAKPRPELLPIDVFPDIFKVSSDKRVTCLKEIKAIIEKHL